MSDYMADQLARAMTRECEKCGAKIGERCHTTDKRTGESREMDIAHPIRLKGMPKV